MSIKRISDNLFNISGKTISIWWFRKNLYSIEYISDNRIICYLFDSIKDRNEMVQLDVNVLDFMNLINNENIEFVITNQ